MNEEAVVFAALNVLGIDYRALEHPSIFTIEEMEQAHVDDGEEIPKNLFLKDEKGKRHFLVALKKYKTADLKVLREKLQSRPLSFASEERLLQCLGLKKGAVTVFGVLNDEKRAVEVVIDAELRGCSRIGFHANRNTCTVFLAMEDVEKVLRAHGNTVTYIDL